MADTIRFILNGKLREVADLSPTTTVLQYLRTVEHLTGTKEGCAEGDCGACTVIVGTLANGAIRYHTVNSCIMFLPVLDGKHLITVEYLKVLAGGSLHPVQQAMVDCHGSQCGFCTPGFVMSLVGLLENTPVPSKEDIQDSLAGNLCRCTGYRPILDAASTAARKGKVHLPSDAQLLRSLQRDALLTYEVQGQKYFAPRTADELAGLVTENPEAILLAGGTDVGLWVTKQHKLLMTLIYTGAIAELHEINETDGNLEIGAAVSYTQAFEKLAAYDESMEVLLQRFASTQIRNSGTVGGNIANGSPIGDGMPPLIALGAKLVLRSAAGVRMIALEDYFISYGKQDRMPGEFIEKIIVPGKAANVLFKTYKLSKRFDQDISAVCSAFALTMDGKTIKSARIAFGGMAATPKRALNVEKYLTGRQWTDETVREAMQFLAQDYTPIKDMRASAEYRMVSAQNLLYRFYIETSEPGTKLRIYGNDG